MRKLKRIKRKGQYPKRSDYCLPENDLIYDSKGKRHCENIKTNMVNIERVQYIFELNNLFQIHPN